MKVQWTLSTSVDSLVEALNVCEQQVRGMQGFTYPADKWHIRKEGKKFIYLDCGGSGAFLIEKATGELFNIKGYGVPDYNKKQKANLGNLATVDPETLHRKRHNYLR